MHKILATLVLPAEITAFERSYLARINRIGLGFFALHVPVLAVLAYFNDTGPWLAIVLSTAVLLGPALAYRVFANPRVMSLTYGFTAMLMGGLLVHFGQGPVQIEMHFYFFALLAMLVLFGNPMSIVVAAVTVAVHHLVLWIVLPASVFNYDAPIWVVAVHAAFVVLESIAACFIARSFFDNVIGLEKIVAQRTVELDARNQAMRLVLDNVQQGLLTIDRHAVIRAERSAVVEQWLGPIDAGTGFAALLGRSDLTIAAWFEVGWVEVLDGVMPLPLTLAQLPTKITVAGRNLELAYTPIFAAGGESGEVEQVMVMLSDVSEANERERLEAQQRELVAMFNRFVHDRRGVIEFLDEGDALIERIAEVGEPARTKRALHTLKGNAGILGAGSIASLCHALETQLEESSAVATTPAVQELVARWQALRAELRPLLGEGSGDEIDVDREAHAHLVAAIRAGRPADELSAELESWWLEPTALRLARIADQARRIATRLGKGPLDVVIEHGRMRLAAERWAPFWSIFIHVVRNALDHGIEAPAVRVERGKSVQPRILLATYVADNEIVIAIEDDGAGVDLDRLAAAAARVGLAPASRDELLRTMFHDGVTTTETVGEFSGRGIGMGAVQAACVQLGGRVVATSETGRFTRIEFHFPIDALASVGIPLAA